MNADPAERWRAVVSQPLDIEPFAPPTAAVSLDVAGASLCGSRHPHNGDHYLVLRLARVEETIESSLGAADLPPRFEESAYALLVADGLGDQGAGVRGSRAALAALAHLVVRYGKWNLRVTPESMAEITEQGEFFFRQVNDAVRLAGQSDFSLAGLATSLTALYVAGEDLFFAHAGHSTAFLFRSGALIQLTTDRALQPLRQEGPGRKAIKRAEPQPNPRVSEKLGRRAGDQDVEIEHIRLLSGDRLLLCTNGLTDLVTQEQIADQLALMRRPCDDCQYFIDLTRAEASHDDVTVLIADYRLRDL
jgi:protein phosphatase